MKHESLEFLSLKESINTVFGSIYGTSSGTTTPLWPLQSLCNFFVCKIVGCCQQDIFFSPWRNQKHSAFRHIIYDIFVWYDYIIVWYISIYHKLQHQSMNYMTIHIFLLTCHSSMSHLSAHLSDLRFKAHVQHPVSLVQLASIATYNPTVSGFNVFSRT